MRLKKYLRGCGGSTHLSTLILLIVILMFIAAMMVLAGVLVKQRIVGRAVSRAIVSCGVQNYDQEYGSLIEGSSVSASPGADYSAYRVAFYNSIEQSFPHFNKATAGSGGTTYVIENTAGQYAFTLEDLSLDVSPENRTMPDGGNMRLTYTVTGTLRIPMKAFGYDGTLALPIRKTATYQQIG